jgi:hypothetical protein
VLTTSGAITRTHVALTNPAYTYNWETSTRKAKTTNTPLQCWSKRTKAALLTSRRRMSPPARRTPPLLQIGSPARQGVAPEQGAEVYTVLSEGQPTAMQAYYKTSIFFFQRRNMLYQKYEQCWNYANAQALFLLRQDGLAVFQITFSVDDVRRRFHALT